MELIGDWSIWGWLSWEKIFDGRFMPRGINFYFKWIIIKNVLTQTKYIIWIVKKGKGMSGWIT